MAIEFRCEECQKRLRVKDQHAGLKIRCPHCEAVIHVPDAEAEDDEEVETSVESRRAKVRRAAESKGPRSARSNSVRSPKLRRNSNSSSDVKFKPSNETKKRKSKPGKGNSYLIWGIVTVTSLVLVLAVGIVGAVMWTSGASQAPGVAAAEPGKTKKAAKNSEYVITQTNNLEGKFVMVWELPKKWTEESGIGDGMFPWATMKGQGQTISITSNRSTSEVAAMRTAMGGALEALKTVHGVRMSKLKTEQLDFEEGPLNVEEGKYSPLIWSNYDYKGVFGKTYGVRCTIDAPIMPCSLTMEGSQASVEKWRPVFMHIAGSVHFEPRKGAEDEKEDVDFDIIPE